MILPKELKERYNEGQNITSLLKKMKETYTNTEEIIEISYDLQAGSYIKAMEDKDLFRQKHINSKEKAKIFS